MSIETTAGSIYENERYSWLYDLELADFHEDHLFYLKNLPPAPAKVLILGCGTGRLALALAQAGYNVTGVDLSSSMLKYAAGKVLQTREPLELKLVCMDMTQLALAEQYDAVIVPYNTLNLLVQNGALDRCLAGVSGHLIDNGVFLSHVYVPNCDILELEGKRLFQFQIFNPPGKGKVIKEILRGYDADNLRIKLTEIFRIRPIAQEKENEDWQYDYELLAFSADEWVRRLSMAGLITQTMYGDYSLKPFTEHEDSIFLLKTVKESK